jgi:hypothetical protein
MVLSEFYTHLLQSPKPKLRLALVPIPPTSQPTRKSKDISLCQALSQSQPILGLLRWKPPSIFSEMEEDLNFSKMEDDLNFSKMEDDLNFHEKGRKSKFLEKWKTI